MKTLKSIAEGYIAEADRDGTADLGGGLTLATAEVMQSEQKGWDDEDPSKGVDFSTSPYWVWYEDVEGVDDAEELALTVAESLNWDVIVAASAMGSVKSKKKAGASRENGKKGGRPRTPRNLEDLWEMMLDSHPSVCDADGNWKSDLPTFGGDDAYRQGVWSWDESHLIKGTCKEDLELVRRDSHKLYIYSNEKEIQDLTSADLIGVVEGYSSEDCEAQADDQYGDDCYWTYIEV